MLNPSTSSPFQLGIEKLLDSDKVASEIRTETNTINPSVLNLNERLEYLMFALRHKLTTQKRNMLSSYLHLGAKEILEATRKSLPTEGPSIDQVGGHALTKKEMHTYSEKGLLGPYNSDLSDSELEKLKAYCHDQANTDHAYLLNEDIFNLAKHPQIVDRVSSILGERFDCIRSNVFVKEGNSQSKPTQWHIAMPSYFGSEDNANSNDYVSVWMTLTHTAKENGCLKMIPGSFKIYPAGLLGKLSTGALTLDNSFDAFFRAKFIQSVQGKLLSSNKGSQFSMHLADRTNGANIVQRALDYNKYLSRFIRENKLEAVSMEAKAGQFYIFSSENFHASLPNTSNQTRISVAFRYARAELNMSRVRNSITMLKMLPERLQKKIKHSGKYHAPVIRIKGQEILESEMGNKVHLDKGDLFGKQ